MTCTKDDFMAVETGQESTVWPLSRSSRRSTAFFGTRTNLLLLATNQSNSKMNMNRSGHHEMRDPDWYSRSADRAKLSPNTLDTESLGGSLNSLNLSFNTLAEDHVSIRSLPVIPSSSASIAASVDAPWNQSPQSLRTGVSRTSSSRQPLVPTGISALDHLENSISSLRATAPPVASIITEEDEVSLASMNFQEDTAATSNNNNEMDATAHAGNRSHAVQHPVSPLRTSMLPSSPVRAPRNFQSCDTSYAGSSITSARSWRPRITTTTTAATDEQSLSTLGDGDDFEDDADDDNLSIIKLLRNQVEALKGQLIAEQEKNRSAPVVLERSHGSFGHDYSSDADSFGGDEVSSKMSSSRYDGGASSFSKLPDATPHDKFAEAQEGMASAMQSIRSSWKRRIASATDSDDDENLVDELVLCELEAHGKAMQREYAQQQNDHREEREAWEKKLAEQERLIADLKSSEV